MSLFEEQFRPPKCCRGCKHLDHEWDEYKEKTYYHCLMNMFFPTKKLTCKRREDKCLTTSTLKA